MKRIYWAFLLIIPFIIFSIFGRGKELDVVPLPGKKYFDSLASSFARAEKSIVVVMFEFFLSDSAGRSPDSLLNLLINASRRGVDVRVILEGGEKHLGKRFRNRIYKTAERLKRGGVKVYLEEEGLTTHVKMAIVDGKEVFIGSANWTYWGLNKNNESNVLIRSEKIASFFEDYVRDIKVSPY
jgi:phosphatidylserine/phosphatidylglycerophosphate/cardiolipin synthase-like enzyme